MLSVGVLCVLNLRPIIALKVPANTYLCIQVISIIITRNFRGNPGHKVIQLMTLRRDSQYAAMTCGRPVPFLVVAIAIRLMTTTSGGCTTTFSRCRLDATSSPHNSHSTQYDAAHSYCHTHHNSCIHRTKVKQENMNQAYFSKITYCHHNHCQNLISEHKKNIHRWNETVTSFKF
jgi:hypothetical protein